VPVHDVGVHEHRVFLAMEFIDGGTLRPLLGAERRPWRELLPVMISAGRGLAAAHDAGLVHRDFKPDNVLVGDEGSVKVTDFGLARETKPALGRASVASAAVGWSPPADGPRLDVSGAGSADALGTPAYMAPEQHFALPTDAKTDQFSFCVVLYEALYGQHPYKAASISGYALAKAEAEIAEAPPSAGVPRWLHQIVTRGLNPEPEERHPSMAALLDALATDVDAIRRRRLQTIAAGIVVVGGVGLARLGGGGDPRCGDLERHLDGVWDSNARTQVGDALRGVGVGFAQSTLERVNAHLDTYAEAWVVQRKQACEATHVTGEQSSALMDLRMECLDERLQALRSVVGVLSRADATVTQNAVHAVAGLPRLADCADTAALRSEAVPPDPAIAQDVAVVRETLARARAEQATAHYPLGLELTTDAAQAARKLGYAPLLVTALQRLGRLLADNGTDDAAKAAYEEAFFLAVEHHLDESAARAAAGLVVVVGRTLSRPAEGRRWADHALAHARAANEPMLIVAVTHALAGVAHEEGKYDEARALALEARELRTKHAGPGNHGELGSLNLLGLVESDSGHPEQARRYFDEGLELGRELLGADHPDLAKTINNMARLSLRSGDIDRAAEAFERALALLSEALGPQHRNVAQLQNNLAAVALRRGQADEAARRFELALQIWEKALGGQHPKVADALNNLAVVASERGEYKAAVDYDERALAIRKRTMAPDHPNIAQNYHNLAENFQHLGQLERALELHRKALVIWDEKLGPNHDAVAGALTGVGADLVLLGRADEAVEPLVRALGIGDVAKIDAVDRAHTRWYLARALWDAGDSSGRDRPRATSLATQAADAYEASGELSDAADARAWLAGH